MFRKHQPLFLILDAGTEQSVAASESDAKAVKPSASIDGEKEPKGTMPSPPDASDVDKQPSPPEVEVVSTEQLESKEELNFQDEVKADVPATVIEKEAADVTPLVPQPSIEEQSDLIVSSL